MSCRIGKILLMSCRIGKHRQRRILYCPRGSHRNRRGRVDRARWLGTSKQRLCRVGVWLVSRQSIIRWIYSHVQTGGGQRNAGTRPNERSSSQAGWGYGGDGEELSRRLHVHRYAPPIESKVKLLKFTWKKNALVVSVNKLNRVTFECK